MSGGRRDRSSVGIVALCLALAAGIACSASKPAHQDSTASANAAGEELARVRLAADVLRPLGERAGRSTGSLCVVVNGEEIPWRALDRTLVYLVGRTYLEGKVRDLLVLDEVENRRKNGVDAVILGLDDAALAKEVAILKEQAQAMSPRGSRAAAGFGRERLDESGLAELAASWLRFEAAFLPDRRGEETNPILRVPLREWYAKALKDRSTIRTASDGLPPEVVLTVNGRTLATADAFADLAPLVSRTDRENAVRWTARATATRQALVRAGVYLPEEEFVKQWRALVSPYEKSPLNIEVIATSFKGFPSYDLYREYFRLRKSFERTIEKEMTEGTLARHRDRVQYSLGYDRGYAIDAQVILLAAVDPTSLASKGPDAFERAGERAQGVMVRLRAGDAFEDLIDRFSEFVDPPDLSNGRSHGPPSPRSNRGRFGWQPRDVVRRLLGESEFEELLRGYSVAETLLCDAPIGEVVGPIRGPLGWYVGRVLGRFPGEKPIDLGELGSLELVREDYGSRRFLEWSNDVVARSTIEVR